MNAKQAVTARITELCKEHDVTVNTLANNAGVPPSTMQKWFSTYRKRPSSIN